MKLSTKTAKRFSVAAAVGMAFLLG